VVVWHEWECWHACSSLVGKPLGWKDTIETNLLKSSVHIWGCEMNWWGSWRVPLSLINTAKNHLILSRLRTECCTMTTEWHVIGGRTTRCFRITSAILILWQCLKDIIYSVILRLQLPAKSYVTRSSNTAASPWLCKCQHPNHQSQTCETKSTVKLCTSIVLLCDGTVKQKKPSGWAERGRE
jgi:hypothetical protein